MEIYENKNYFAEFENFKNVIRNFFENIHSIKDELNKFIGLKIHVVV